MNDTETLAKAFARFITENPSIFTADGRKLAERIINGNAESVESAYAKLWQPEKGTGYFFVSTGGKVMHDTWGGFQMDSGRLSANNVFRSEESAAHSAATFKIQNLVWRWKEHNDPKVPQNGDDFYHVESSWSKWHDNSSLVWSADAGTGEIGVFTSQEKAYDFIRGCKPQLDEYAHAMGWM